MPTVREQLKLAELRTAYRNKQNIMRLCRETLGQTTNDPLAILASYDLQAGSYVAALDDADFAAYHNEYSAAIAAILERLQPATLLEAGVGEATTLLGVVRHLKNAVPVPVLGFDISWSRIHVGREHWQAHCNQPVRLFVGELEAIPLPDQAIDVVFTSHAIEPNHGRERLILCELGRVTSRFLVLLEPGYEFAGPEARQYMEAQGYCRGLPAIAQEEGFIVREHRLLEVNKIALNPTAVLVLEKTPGAAVAAAPNYACPSCHAELVPANDVLFCDREGLAYPILRGLPCLCRANGIIASHFLNTLRAG